MSALKEGWEGENRLGRESEVFPGSEFLIRGEVPKGLWLVAGPPGVGKTTFCEEFLHDGLARNETCIHLVTEMAPDFVRGRLSRFGINVEDYEQKGLLRVVDCYTWKLGGAPVSKYFANPYNLSDVSIAIENARTGLTGFSLVIDSLPALLNKASREAREKFMEVISARVGSAHGIGICVLTTGVLDETYVNFIKSICVGVIEMKLDDKKKEMTRYLRIYSAKGVPHNTGWTEFKIGREGIMLNRDQATQETRPRNGRFSAVLIDSLKKYLKDADHGLYLLGEKITDADQSNTGSSHKGIIHKLKRFYSNLSSPNTLAELHCDRFAEPKQLVKDLNNRSLPRRESPFAPAREKPDPVLNMDILTYRIRVTNKRKRFFNAPARNCYAWLKVDGEQDPYQLRWTGNRECVTINVGDHIEASLCALAIGYGVVMALPDSSYSSYPRFIEAAGRTLSGTVHITSENARSIRNTFEINVAEDQRSLDVSLTSQD